MLYAGRQQHMGSSHCHLDRRPGSLAIKADQLSREPCFHALHAELYAFCSL